MSRLFSVLFLMIFLCFFLVSCERKEVEDYDYSNADFLIRTCANLEEGKAEKILEEKDALTSSSKKEFESLFRVFEQQQKQQKILSEIQALMQKGEYSELKKKVEFFENQGNAFPEILYLRNFIPALQALNVYCARLPMQDSDSLHLALEILNPYTTLLNDSEVFRRFYAEQTKTLEKMKTSETAVKSASVKEDMMWAAAAGAQQKNVGYLRKLKKINPDDPLFSYIASENGKPTGHFHECMIKYSQESLLDTERLPGDFSLAILLLFDCLSPDEIVLGKTIFVKKNIPGDDFAGTILKACFLKADFWIRQALWVWTTRSPLAGEAVPPFAAGYLLETMNRLNAADNGSRYSIPAITDFAEIINILE